MEVRMVEPGPRVDYLKYFQVRQRRRRNWLMLKHVFWVLIMFMVVLAWVMNLMVAACM